MIDEFKTISDTVGEGYYTEKRSKFLAFAHHVTTVDEVKEIVASYRKKYYDARHVCYAYMLGAARKDFRANDNGEPSGFPSPLGAGSANGRLSFPRTVASALPARRNRRSRSLWASEENTPPGQSFVFVFNFPEPSLPPVPKAKGAAGLGSFQRALQINILGLKYCANPGLLFPGRGSEPRR